MTEATNGGVVLLPQDLTGKNPSNRVVREPQLSTEIDDKTKNILITTFTPIFPNDFVLEERDTNGDMKEWELGVDYDFTLPFYSLKMETGVDVYGGVKLFKKPSGPMLFVTYQALGGHHSADRRLVLEALANYIWQPRIVQFDQLTNVQETFPPNQHKQNLENFTRWDDVVVQLNLMTEAMGVSVEPTLLYQRETIYLREAYDQVYNKLLDLESEQTILKQQIAELQRRI